MQIGLNWTYPNTFSIIEKLIIEKHADFIEISLDNFIHLNPEKILNLLNDIPTSFHILSSCFLEKTENELQEMAEHIRHWIKVLKPIYVSDHLAQFFHDENRLPLFMEIDYSQEEFIFNRVSLWQEMLDCQLFLENFASVLSIHVSCQHDPADKPRDGGWHPERHASQPQFFKKLITTTNAQLLFDFSNAYIAEENGVCNFIEWQELIKTTKHFHTAGFRKIGNPPLAMDTHDVEIHKDVIARIQQTPVTTLVIERDAHISYQMFRLEIARVRGRSNAL